MLRQLLSKERQEGGFSLIEILVVILVIGILAAIAIPMFLNQRRSANDAAVQSDIRNAAFAAENWMIKNPNSATPSQQLFVGPVKANYGGQEFTVSPGVHLEIVNFGRQNKDTIGAYVIYAYHEDGNQYKECNKLRYSSNEGGYSNSYGGNFCPAE